jgi:hypothetical protein
MIWLDRSGLGDDPAAVQYFLKTLSRYYIEFISVTDGGEGVCVDPGEKGAILGAGGPGPPGGGKGWQLAPDSGGEET